MPSEWRTLGTSVPSVDSRAIVTGAQTYPTDVAVPGMLHAAIVRSPHHRASLTSFDVSAAEKVPGARVLRDADLLAVVARDAADARRAAAQIRAEWKREPLTPQDEWPRLFTETAVAPVEQPRARYPPLLVRGDVDAGLAAAARRKASTYWLPPIAHVPLEPRRRLRSGTVTR